MSLEQKVIQGDLFEDQVERKYTIPRLSIDPTANKKVLTTWIREFCRANTLSLPKGFHRKTKRQLLGMYHGMEKTYEFSVEDINVRRMPYGDYTPEEQTKIRPGYNFRGYRHAEWIMKQPEDEEGLKTLIYDLTRNDKFIKSLDDVGLRHQGHIIKGVAKTMLKHRKQ